MLHREHRGVFRVGHRAPSLLARFYAAVAACGASAVLSGLAAAHLWGILRGRQPAPEVTTTALRMVRGVIVHRARRLDVRDTTTREGIRCTSLARTLVDLAAVLSLGDLARCHHEAVVRHGLRAAEVEAVLARRPNSAGAQKLRSVISGDATVLLGRLERGFRAYLRAHGFPLPVTNREAGAHYVDCRWAEHRVTVELDGYRFHNSRHAWERDRERERAARGRGDEFRRFSWRDVFEDQTYMSVELIRMLPASRASG